MKKVAVLQSNYIPWKGYFDVIGMVDEFIFYDEMQYTKNDWRNRNKIKTEQGLKWLTIPVENSQRLTVGQKISETLIFDKRWNRKHWETIKNAYRRAPFFNKYKDVFEYLYLGKDEDRLVDVNYKFIYAICNLLDIKTKISFDKDYGLIDGKTERIVNLVQKANGTEYLSGPAAKDYIQESLFEDAGIKLTWMDYSHYSEYSQLYPPFEHGVSIIDLLFNCGDDAKYKMKFTQNNT